MKNTPKPLLPLLKQFITDLQRGTHLKTNGARFQKGSISKYQILYKHLADFESYSDTQLNIIASQHLTNRKLRVEQNYWKKFYSEFSKYLYEQRNCYDNYVGRLWTTIKTLFNYLEQEKNIHTGAYRKFFYSRSEETQIVVLTPQQLHFLIYDTPFHTSLPRHLQRVKDIFVVGCTVALRFSDLIQLTPFNLIQQNESTYLLAKSQKTHTRTQVKLPEYICEIIRNHQDKRRKTLFSPISKNQFNQNLKQIGKLAGWDYDFPKTREQNGISKPIYKNVKTKAHYQFYDHMSSHTMRRTAITSMLMLGVPEIMVRGISGHAPNSKEFFRYVELTQKYLDQETDKVFETMMEY